MKVSANGSMRKVRTHKLIDAELNKFDGNNSAACSWNDANGGVKISFSTSKKIELNGEYDFVIELSQNEIARIFYHTFSDVPLGDAFRSMESREWRRFFP
ncbi:MAG: hypothetical protein ACYC1L_18350 [Alphaproteobacteria bacterium]